MMQICVPRRSKNIKKKWIYILWIFLFFCILIKFIKILRITSKNFPIFFFKTVVSTDAKIKCSPNTMGMKVAIWVECSSYIRLVCYYNIINTLKTFLWWFTYPIFRGNLKNHSKRRNVSAYFSCEFSSTKYPIIQDF